MTEEPQREYYTLAEVRKILSIGKSKCYEIVSNGELPAIRVGKAIRVHRADLEAWAARNRHAGPASR